MKGLFESISIKVHSSIIDQTTGCINANTKVDVEVFDSLFYNITSSVAVVVVTTQNSIFERCCFYKCYDNTATDGSVVRINSKINATQNQNSVVLCRHKMAVRNYGYITDLIGSGLTVLNENNSRNSIYYGVGVRFRASLSGSLKYYSATDFLTGTVVIYILSSPIIDISNAIILHGSSLSTSYGALCCISSTTVTMSDSYMIDLQNTNYIYASSSKVQLNRSSFSFSRESYQSNAILFVDDCVFEVSPEFQMEIDFDFLNTYLCEKGQYYCIDSKNKGCSINRTRLTVMVYCISYYLLIKL